MPHNLWLQLAGSMTGGPEQAAFYPGAIYLLSRWYTRKASGTCAVTGGDLTLFLMIRNLLFGLHSYMADFSPRMHLGL